MTLMETKNGLQRNVQHGNKLFGNNYKETGNFGPKRLYRISKEKARRLFVVSMLYLSI